MTVKWKAEEKLTVEDLRPIFYEPVLLISYFAEGKAVDPKLP
jgi:hypothetical protein